MQRTYKKVNGGYMLDFTYSASLIAEVQQIPGRRYFSQVKQWFIPDTYENSAKFFKENRFQEFRDITIRQIPEPPPMRDLAIDIPLKETLRHYQGQGVQYNVDRFNKFGRYGGILGDEPGLGKTAQAIATVVATNQFPCLVICPASLKPNWEREWNMWTNRRVKILTPGLLKYYKHYEDAGLGIDVFIVNYESLKKYFVSEIKEHAKLTLDKIVFNQFKDHFRSLIVDESHRVKDTTTAQAKFVKGISHNKNLTLCLTGTPVVNTPKDLVSPLAICNQLQVFGGYKNFIDRYCRKVKKPSDKITIDFMNKELNLLLRTHCFYVREKALVLKELPDKQRTIVTVEIDNRKEYEKAQNDLEEYLIQYKSATEADVMRAMRGKIMVQFGILKNISARGKMKAVVEYYKDLESSNTKMISFMTLHEVVDILKHHFPKAVMLTGRESPAEKQISIDAFQKDPNVLLFIASIKSAGVGITLTASSRVSFIELPWTAADCVQCEDRAHRLGQKDSVEAIYFLGKDTIDEHIYENILLPKFDMHKKIMGSTVDVESSAMDAMINLYTNKTKGINATKEQPTGHTESPAPTRPESTVIRINSSAGNGTGQLFQDTKEASEEIF